MKSKRCATCRHDISCRGEVINRIEQVKSFKVSLFNPHCTIHHLFINKDKRTTCLFSPDNLQHSTINTTDREIRRLLDYIILLLVVMLLTQAAVISPDTKVSGGISYSDNITLNLKLSPSSELLVEYKSTCSTAGNIPITLIMSAGNTVIKRKYWH